jgi:hypothetical protein
MAEEREDLNNRIGNNFQHANHFLLNSTHQLMKQGYVDTYSESTATAVGETFIIR